MKYHTNQLLVGISYSYIQYIDEYLSLLNNSLYSSIHYLDEETASLIEDMKQIFLELPELFSNKQHLKEDYAAKVMSFRLILEKKYRVLSAYQRELHHLMTLSNFSKNNNLSIGDMHISAATQVDEIDFGQLISDCIHFVFDDNRLSVRQQRASLLLPYIPMKMTKENYLNYVQKSIVYIDPSNTLANTTLLTSVLLQLFDGHTCPYYGEYFKDIADTLNELQSPVSTEVFYEDTELLGETLNTLMTMLHNLYRLTGSLANLLLLEELDFEMLTSLHISFYDLYYTLKNILTSEENKELFLTSLPEQVSSIKTTLESTYYFAIEERQPDSLFSLMHTYLSTDIDHVFGFSLTKHPDPSAEINLVFDDFITQLSEKLYTFPAAERKIRMQYFISTIPFIMSHQNFHSYLTHSFDTSSNPVQNLTAVMYLEQILEENGYFEAESTKSPNTHHHHHGDCGCKDHHY